MEIYFNYLKDVDYKLDSWFDVQKKDIWTPYRATSSTYNPFRQKEIYTATFIIGDDNCFTKFDKTEMKPENMVFSLIIFSKE